MLNYSRRKVQKHKDKRTFKEYGFSIKNFQLPNEGKVDYAQWLHPFEGEKEISQEQVDFYAQFIKKGDLAIDIGAHTGDTSVPMALAAGAEGMVLAFEPHPYVFKVLEENANLNKEKTNIKAECYAITSHKGEFVFNYSDASFCNGGYLSKIKNNRHNHNYELNVKGINLEEYLGNIPTSVLKRLAFVKIDTEGYDKEIIKSIANVLAQYRPYLIAECLKKLTLEERHELYDVIDQKDYIPHYLERFEKGAELITIKRDDMNKWEHFDILAIPKEKSKQT